MNLDISPPDNIFHSFTSLKIDMYQYQAFCAMASGEPSPNFSCVTNVGDKNPFFSRSLHHTLNYPFVYFKVLQVQD